VKFSARVLKASAIRFVVSVPRSHDVLQKNARAVRAAAGLFGGFVLLASINAVAIAVAVPLPSGGVSQRLAHHVFDAAETVGVGAVLAVVLGLFMRVVRLPPWGEAAALFAVAFGVVDTVLGQYLRLLASHTLGGPFETPLFAAYLAIPCIAIAGAPFVASLCFRHKRLRFLPVAVATGTMIGSQTFLRDDYAGIHSIVASGAVLLAAPGLAPFFERLGRTLAGSRPGCVALAALALFALLGIAVPPPNATRFELFRQPCAVGPWVLASLLWRAPPLHKEVTLPSSPWLENRSGASPIPKTAPSLLPSDALVVLLTVDALRGDVVDDPANDVRFPTLAKLKREGIVFAHASAPGTQTVLSLSTLFSGAYFSEHRWVKYGIGRSRFFFPLGDPFPRFPQFLTDHGVETTHEASLVFLNDDFGVARGFHDENRIGRNRHGAVASTLTHALLDRMEHSGNGPHFFYAHFLEPHEPYAAFPARGTDYDRYLAAVGVVDRQIGRLLETLERKQGNRWALFVTADHGEAFGEHRTFEHAKTLYEELLHVPLLARSPLFRPRVIDERVGLVDLGPTILDLFGADTPATWNGQSLVPLLAGRRAELTRPLIAEGRLRRALTEQDGLKVIEDAQRKVVEVYDLALDPGETRNLFDVDPVRSDLALAKLRTFFAVHAWRQDGYEPPYLP
jgi:arylsulfatase A-like enzyme